MYNVVVLEDRKLLVLIFISPERSLLFTGHFCYFSKQVGILPDQTLDCNLQLSLFCRKVYGIQRHKEDVAGWDSILWSVVFSVSSFFLKNKYLLAGEFWK